jgi:1-acyl-sn-glycerol-3-phosphate acyltransferase
MPLRRFEADIGAVLASERLLRQGGVLGMFPEGTRSRTAILQDFHPGTATLALRTGAQILPCSIVGTNKLKNLRAFFTRPRISVRFGPPIPVERVKRPTPEQVSALTAEINSAIRSLLPVEYGGTYTG